MRAAVFLLLAALAACSGSTNEPGLEQNGGGDPGLAPPGGAFQRAPDGNIPPIPPPPAVRGPAATPTPGVPRPGPDADSTARSIIADERIYSCSIDGDVETLDGVLASQPPAPGEARTTLAIDGDPSDWQGRPALTPDPNGDAEQGFPDFGAVRAFHNADALYMVIDAAEFTEKFDSFEIYMESNGRRFFAVWSPSSEYGWAAEVTGEWTDIGQMIRSNFAFGDAFEVRIDPRDVGADGRLAIERVQVMATDEWRAVELVELTDPIPGAAEHDPAWRLVEPGGADEKRVLFAIPDTRVMAVQHDPVSEMASVSGGPGAVPPLAAVLVGNLQLNDFVTVAADIRGAFSARIAAVEGTHIMVKQDTTGRFIRADRHTFDENLISPGVLIQIPVSPTENGVAFSAGARPCCGSDPIAPFTISGVIDTDRVEPGDRFRAAGTVTIFTDEAYRPRNEHLQFQVTLVGDAGGRQVGRAGKFISPFLTPTGLPIERTLDGPPIGRVDLGGQEISFEFDGRRWVSEFNIELRVPGTLRTGTYGLVVENLWNINGSALPAAAGLRPFDIVTRDANQHRPTLATLVVGAPQPLRLTTTLLADEVDDGARGGLIAREDFGLFDIGGRSSSRHEPVIPRLDAFGNPWSYSLEPYAPMLDVVDRALPGPPALNPDLFNSALKVTIQRPDGGTDVLGPAPLTRYAVQSPRTPWGDPLGLGGGELREIPQLMGDGETFAYSFPADGDYVVTLNGRVADTQGNVHGICGTYDVTVANHLELETALLPTTPFEVGDSIAPTVTLLPGVAANVTYTVTHVAADGAVDQQTFTGIANPFGWWDGGEATYTFNRDGEYRVDIDARYESPDGRIWVGRMKFGGVVATPDAPVIVHGRRGPDGQTELAAPWAFEESFISEDSAHWQFPYFTGDVLWGDTEPGPGQAVVTHLSVQSTDDSDPLVQRALALTQLFGEQSELPVEIALRAGQTPLTLAPEDPRLPGSHPDELSLWAYVYGSAERPGVRVREMIQGDDVNGGYWRFGDAYHGQLGNGPEGDLPGDFKFLYGGAVIRDPVAGEGVYAIYGSSWVHTEEDDPLGSRTFPPFQGAAGGPDGGPLFTTHGRDIDIFMTPMAVRPGAVLEVGDRFRMSGPVMPTLPSLVEYTVIAPDGTRRDLGGRANAVGYFYDPLDDFTVDQPGLWTVEMTVTHDGATSAGPVERPFPTGGPLTPDGRSFRFVAADRSTQRVAIYTDLADLEPRQWFEQRSDATFSANLPSGWTGESARLIVTMPGNVLVDEQLEVAAGSVTWTLNVAGMNRIASNFDTGGGLYDTLTVTLFAGAPEDSEAPGVVATLATHGARVPEVPPSADQ